MKWTMFALMMTCCAISLGMAAPGRNAMVYYQNYPGYYSARQTLPATHRMMYVQYVRPRTADGGEVSAGTYYKETNEGSVQPSFATGNEATAIAEAYPAYYPPEDSDVPSRDEEQFELEGNGAQDPVYDPVNDPRDREPELLVPNPENDFVSFAQEPAGHDVELDDDEVDDLPARPAVAAPPARPAAPAPPAKPAAPAPTAKPAVAAPAYIPPKKKVRVESKPAAVPQSDYNRRPSSNKPSGSAPHFPVNFGRTDGGAIAIANSYSTGQGGAATSQATAFGDPQSYRFYKKNVRH